MARPRTFDEHAVIRQAREVFHDRGYAPTSVGDLTAATGLSRSSLYGAFDDKHTLFLRSFEQYCEEEQRGLELELGGDDRGARGRIERHFRTKVSDPDASQRGCLLAKATAELASEDADVAQLAGDFYAAYERALVGCVRGAQAAGDMRTDLDAADVGALLLASLRGIEALGRAGRSAASLRVVADATLASLVAAPVAA